ncbi:hypothetical protein NMG60_11025520 [Bertholletia excelsa]
MAETAKRSSVERRQLSRLQQRAPASVETSRSTDWKVAIPLLSPLVTSPTESDLAVAIRSCGNPQHQQIQVAEAEKPLVFNKWQHPAAPFGYKPAPLVPFVCSGAVDRT